MSFQGKAFWTAAKDGSCLNDGEIVYDGSSGIVYENSSEIEPKRPQPWFLDASEQELFPNKKQAVETSNRSFLGASSSSTSQWENTSSFQSVSNPFTDRLFGSEPPTSFSYGNQTISVSPIEAGNLNLGRSSIEEQFGNDASIALSMSHTTVGPVSSLSYGGIRKVKINQVKDSDTGLSASIVQDSNTRENNTIYFSQAQDTENMSMTIGHTYDKGDSNTISFSQGNDSDNGIGNTFNKEDANTISFGGFHNDPETNSASKLISNYDLLLNQSSVQSSETLNQKDIIYSNTEVTKETSQLTSTGSDTSSKNKSENKVPKKVAPNNFPSNVRSLLSTGIFDDVPVKYISWSREKELRGVVKGSGYLCSCQSCNYKKALNAYEFERHAGCKTKHPNNHIYFENGKTIYAVVQELRSTPQSLLFVAIQTVTGSPVNEKSFRIWKESFQAATRELQRIYGTDEIQQL